MNANYTKQVIELAAATNPVERPTARDWATVERELGLRLPPDYKDLVSALGTGWFGDGLTLRNPQASSEYILLSKDALIKFGEVLSETGRRFGVALFPEEKGLLAIGEIDRQMFLLRPNRSGGVFDQLVWWDTDYGKAIDLRMTITQFIHDLYLNRIQEPWAEDLGNYFWRDNSEPFFTCWRGPTP